MHAVQEGLATEKDPEPGGEGCERSLEGRRLVVGCVCGGESSLCIQ